MLRMLNKRGKVCIQPIPKLKDVMVFKRSKANLYLRFCPFSDYFCADVEIFRQKFGKKSVAQAELASMVIRWHKVQQTLSSVSERNSVEEKSPMVASMGYNNNIADIIMGLRASLGDQKI